MRTIVLVIAITSAVILSAPSCSHPPPPVAAAGSAVGSAGACEVSALEQVVVADGVSIVADIFSAVSSGGSTLPKLFSDLIAEFGPPTIQCAATLVADIATALSPPHAGSGAGGPLTPAHAGRSALLSEMDKRGWPHGK